MSDPKQSTTKTIRIALIIAFILGFIGMMILGPLTLNGDSMTAAPEPIIGCAAFSLFFIFFPKKETSVRKGEYPGLFRRYCAANIDMVIAMMLTFSILFPVMLLIENSARGEWAWSWDTAISPFYIPASFIGILACFVGIYFYFRIHLERGRITPGQYMMGYKIIATGTPRYNLRIWNGAIWLCYWIFASAARTEVEGVYTWDKNSNSQAVRVE